MPETIDLELRGAGPRKGKRTSEPPRRTTLHEDGMHVGTIIEYVDETSVARGFCVWSAASAGGHASDFEDAKKQIVDSLLR